MPSVFPHGMKYMQEKLGVPMVMHNKMWSSNNDYIKKEKFQWYKSKHSAIPQEHICIY